MAHLKNGPSKGGPVWVTRNLNGKRPLACSHHTEASIHAGLPSWTDVNVAFMAVAWTLQYDALHNTNVLVFVV